MENASEETHSNKNSVSISSEDNDGFTFGLPPHPTPTHYKMVRQIETPIGYYAAIILITEMWQNISGENLRLLHLKILSIFGST